jgi:hypothetical protein
MLGKQSPDRTDGARVRRQLARSHYRLADLSRRFSNSFKTKFEAGPHTAFQQRRQDVQRGHADLAGNLARLVRFELLLQIVATIGSVARRAFHGRV